MLFLYLKREETENEKVKDNGVERDGKRENAVGLCF
jgi:hypothetical protein